MNNPNRSPVLLAEDDPEDRFLAQRAWQKAGCTNPLVTVEDGAKLLEYLRGDGPYGDREAYPAPGLVLLDLNMPLMDGRTALKQIRADEALHSLPVVVLTTSENDQDVVDCYQNGANSYLCKPSDFNELVAHFRALAHYWFNIVELPREIV